MKRFAKEVQRNANNAAAAEGSWFVGVPGIVADNKDPDNQHRVRVIIPSIDEDVVYDEWARQMVFCLGNGFGSAFIPPIGSEVVLFGQLGQKFNLFYASVYNEDLVMPTGYPDENTVGVHAPGNLKFIAELLATLKGQNVDVIAAQLAKINAQNIESAAQQLNKTTGQTIEGTAGGEYKIHGGTVTINSDGSVTISGGPVSITSNGSMSISASGSVTMEGRNVRKVGPPI